MTVCEDCPIEEKIHQCCYRYPLTGQTAFLVLEDGTRLIACPYLDKNGRCIIYDTRPDGCRKHFCERYENTVSSFTDALMENFPPESFYKS